MKLKTGSWPEMDTPLYPNCSHGVGTYWTRSGRRYTGLEKEDIERLGKELGEDLNPNSDFWNTAPVRIAYKDSYVTIDTSEPKGELQYKYLKNHKRVKFGYTDKKAGAEYVLVQEEETAKEVNQKARIERQAISEFGKLSLEDRVKVLRLYGHSAKDVNAEIIESTLYQLVKEDPQKFIDVWVSNDKKEMQYLLEEAVSNGVLRKNKTIYKYGSDILGHTLEDTIDYLTDPKNNDLLIAIKSRLEGKQSAFSTITSNDSENKSEYSKLIEEISSEEEPKKEPKKEEKKTKSK